MNIGNYESIKAQVGLSAYLDPDENLDNAYGEMRNVILDQLMYSLEEAIEKENEMPKMRK